VDMEARRLQQQLDFQNRELSLKEMPYKGALTAAEKIRIATENAKLEEARRQHDLTLRTPVKIGQRRDGTDMMAIMRPNKQGSIDYYPIDETGKVSATPMASGGLDGAPGASGLQAVPGPSAAPQGGFQQAQFNPDEGVVTHNNKVIESGKPVDYSNTDVVPAYI